MDCVIFYEPKAYWHKRPKNRVICNCVSNYRSVIMYYYNRHRLSRQRLLKGCINSLGLTGCNAIDYLQRLASLDEKICIVSFASLETNKYIESNVRVSSHKRLYFSPHENEDFFMCDKNTYFFQVDMTEKFSYIKQALMNKHIQVDDLQKMKLKAIKAKRENKNTLLTGLTTNNVTESYKYGEINRFIEELRYTNISELETLRSKVRLTRGLENLVNGLNDTTGLMGVMITSNGSPMICGISEGLANSTLKYVISADMTNHTYQVMKHWAGVLYKNRNVTSIFELLRHKDSNLYELIRGNCRLIIKYKNDLREAINRKSLPKLRSVCGGLSVAKYVIQFTEIELDTTHEEIREAFRGIPVRSGIYNGTIVSETAYSIIRNDFGDTDTGKAYLLSVVSGVKYEDAMSFITRSKTRTKFIEDFLYSKDISEYSEVIKGAYEKGRIGVLINALKKYLCNHRKNKVDIIVTCQCEINGSVIRINRNCPASEKTKRRMYRERHKTILPYASFENQWSSIM